MVPAFLPDSLQVRRMKNIHILLIEDNRLLRDMLAAMLKEQRDFKVTSSPGSKDAVLKAKMLAPTVVLLDLGLRNQNSLRLLAALRKNAPKSNVIGIDLVPVQEQLVQFVEAGVCGFVLRDATFRDVLKTIRSVAKGVSVLPSLLTRPLFSQIVSHATHERKGNPYASVRMTSREREVIALIAEGLSNKEIAQRLSLAIDTVKSHVHTILEKLALHTRLEIASFAHAKEHDSPGHRPNRRD
jgi:DNA-binding NarL/FixJ family response regulator